MLAAMGTAKDFFGRQFKDAPSLPASETGRQSLQRWFEGAEQWRQFLDRPSCEIIVTFEPRADKNENPGVYYQRVALRLPGLVSSGGTARPELEFVLAQASQPERYRWAPTQGRLEVTLRGMTPKAKDLNAEVEPRVSQSPGGFYGLMELIYQHGQAVDNRADEWLIKLDVDITRIRGLENETVDPAVKSVAFRVKFVDPAGGLPAQLDWPGDLKKLLGPPPQSPWTQVAGER